MVKRHDGVTEYYEQLINYGYNKIAYIENLRFRGWRFVIAGNMFAFDLPHLPYVHRIVERMLLLLVMMMMIV